MLSTSATNVAGDAKCVPDYVDRSISQLYARMGTNTAERATLMGTDPYHLLGSVQNNGAEALVRLGTLTPVGIHLSLKAFAETQNTRSD